MFSTHWAILLSQVLERWEGVCILLLEFIHCKNECLIDFVWGLSVLEIKRQKLEKQQHGRKMKGPSAGVLIFERFLKYILIFICENMAIGNSTN